MQEAMHYFLGTYETEATIGKATDILESLPKTPTETENEFARRIGNEAYRCGNVQPTQRRYVSSFVAY